MTHILRRINGFVLAVFVAIGVAGAPSLSHAQFTDVTSGLLSGEGNSHGVAWGDYDNDGDLDLFVANRFRESRLFRNDGDDLFVNVASGALADTGAGQGVAWADYDNDGDIDLYLAKFLGGANRSFRNDGGGVFADATSGPLGVVGNSIGIAWGDYDNDGAVDLVINRSGQSKILFHNEGGGTFIDATSGPLFDTGSGRGITWGDYDNDGDLDLFLVNAGQPSKLLRNDGGGVFADATSAPLGDAAFGSGAAWADYDNDGDLDLYRTNFDMGNTLLRNEGGGVFTDATAGPLGTFQNSFGVVWGDYDNDGDLDLYVSRYGQPNKLIRNDGVAGFVDVTKPPLDDGGTGQGVAWADYDNDGDLDLYLANTSGPNKLFRNDQTSGNHWLHVDLVGTISNRLGIGARITVVAAGGAQIREVSGGSGFLSQDSPTAEFGLGAAAAIDALIIRWPSGINQAVTPVPTVDQRITVVEDALVAVDGGPRSGAALHGPSTILEAAAPNPFLTTTRVRFTVPASSATTLLVLDASGRLVRTLLSGHLPAGTQSVDWEGRDASGHEVAAGTYFLRLESGSLRQTSKLIFVR